MNHHIDHWAASVYSVYVSNTQTPLHPHNSAQAACFLDQKCARANDFHEILN